MQGPSGAGCAGGGGSHALWLAAGLVGERTAAMGAPPAAMAIAVAPSKLRARESARERAGSE